VQPLHSASPAPSPALQPPPGNPRFPLFDSLRALAALGVVVCHATAAYGAQRSTWWGPLTIQLSAGVPIFFAISGFLLYRPFVAARAGGRPVRVGDYARRRALRIIPGYWFALTILALWPGSRWTSDVFSDRWWIYYGFGHIYSERTYLHGVGVAWSLCTEMAFYLVLPLYAWVALKVSARLGLVRGELLALGVPSLASLAFRGACAAGVIPSRFNLWLPACWYMFAAGMGLAVASVVLRERGPVFRPLRFLVERPEVAWLLGAAFIVIVATTLGPNWTTGAHSTSKVLGTAVLSTAMAFLVVLPAVFGQERGGLVRRLLANRALAWVGVVSYGVYLWHSALIWWLADSNGWTWSKTAPISRVVPGFVMDHQLTSAFAAGVVGLAFTLVAASVSYYAVELPFLRRKEVPLRSVPGRLVRTIRGASSPSGQSESAT
jgi:peptidoglycan/LPS O-acetylase OafA/YrhL